MDADKALAGLDVAGHAFALGRFQGPIAEAGNILAAGVEHQGVETVHLVGVGQDRGVLGNRYIVARSFEKAVENRSRFLVGVTSPANHQ